MLVQVEQVKRWSFRWSRSNAGASGGAGQTLELQVVQVEAAHRLLLPPNGTAVPLRERPLTHCFYHGSVRGLPESRAALSTLPRSKVSPCLTPVLHLSAPVLHLSYTCLTPVLHLSAPVCSCNNKYAPTAVTAGKVLLLNEVFSGKVVEVEGCRGGRAARAGRDSLACGPGRKVLWAGKK
ncbi:hypothetical protein WMY93_033241 [Mugilogobius chulae]|uniref:Uncharacterized protein n=1 Tax=Mugilogobius chulae TaxID=88201 RepID=A0AAW0MSI9_9GOBI